MRALTMVMRYEFCIKSTRIIASKIYYPI